MGSTGQNNFKELKRSISNISIPNNKYDKALADLRPLVKYTDNVADSTIYTANDLMLGG